MTTHAAMAVPRQPFSPLTSPRMQTLQSSKNRQIGLLSSPLCSDSKLKLSAPAKIVAFNPSTKRRFAPSSADDEFDSENIDPCCFNSANKRNKSNDSTPVKLSSSSLPSFSLISKPTISLSATNSNPSTLLPTPLSAIPARLQTPGLRRRTSMAPPRAPLTAPSGRSPRSKRDLKSGRFSAPSTRIGGSSSSAALPFSLDAALAGTLAKPLDHKLPAKTVKAVEEVMPNNWFFDIYEDSPEEEAANLMEHSTLTLDISSDEETTKPGCENKGKENVAPADDDAPSTHSPTSTSPTSTSTSPTLPGSQTIIRRKVIKQDEMDDGERSPLSDLETEDFFAAGLTKDDYIVLPPSLEESSKTAVDSNIEQAKEIFAPQKASLRSVCGEDALVEVPVVNGEGDVKGEILIWEDDAENTPSAEA